MTEYIITKEQIEELNRAHGGMKIVTSWLSCYAIWDTSNIYPVMKSEHVAVDLPEVVRCRDCWYYTDKGNGFFTCGHFDSAHAEVEPYGFCKWASRRDA